MLLVRCCASFSRPRFRIRLWRLLRIAFRSRTFEHLSEFHWVCDPACMIFYKSFIAPWLTGLEISEIVFRKLQTHFRKNTKSSNTFFKRRNLQTLFSLSTSKSQLKTIRCSCTRKNPWSELPTCTQTIFRIAPPKKKHNTKKCYPRFATQSKQQTRSHSTLPAGGRQDFRDVFLKSTQAGWCVVTG